MTALIEQMFIAGKPDAGTGPDTVEVVNPATEEVMGHVPQATPGDVSRAIAAGHAAFGEGMGAWPSMDPRC